MRGLVGVRLQRIAGTGLPVRSQGVISMRDVPSGEHPRESVQRTDPVEAAEEGYPIAPTRDSARALVLDSQERLRKEGLSDSRIDDLAHEFLDAGHAPDPDTFIPWAREKVSAHQP